MSESSTPADPINGGIPSDREYRLAGSTVEQWSSWAGMWDVAYHALSVSDAERYVREHQADETSTYRVAGLRRQQGAIGAFESFLTEQVATTVEAARDAVVQGCYDTGFEHVQIRAVVRATAVNQQVDELASAYWRERWAPGGTIELDGGGVAHSAEAKRIWDDMGTVHERAAAENEATLTRCGVPSHLAKMTASHEDLTLEATSLRWKGHFPDGARLDQLVSPPLRDVEEWTDGFRWVWTDDDRLMVTYCEGDLSGQLFFTPEAFAANWADATEFYAKGH